MNHSPSAFARTWLVVTVRGQAVSTLLRPAYAAFGPGKS
jgi:hypothetical protein